MSEQQGATRLDAIERRLARLEERMAHLAPTIEDLKADEVAKVRKQQAALEERVKELENG